MIRQKHISFLLFVIFCISFSQDDSQIIREDIKKRNKELEDIKREISNVEEQIISNTKKAISTTEKLIDLENKIGLTEKLIRSLKREERYMGELIKLSIEPIRLLLSKYNSVRLTKHPISEDISPSTPL